MSDTNGFNGWAIVELLGHRRLAGMVTETTIAGAGMLRVDIPDVPANSWSPAIPTYTQYVAPSSLYALTPCSEAVAKAAAASARTSPVVALDIPSLPAPATEEDDEDDRIEALMEDLDEGDDEAAELPQSRQ